MTERGSFTRAIVRRICIEVTLRCQRVLARYRPSQDEFEHIAVGDPDPGPVHRDQICGFDWEDEISPCFVLLWRCTREQGHHGEHFAGTGERVAAVHPNAAQGQCARG